MRRSGSCDFIDTLVESQLEEDLAQILFDVCYDLSEDALAEANEREDREELRRALGIPENCYIPREFNVWTDGPLDGPRTRD